MKPVATQLCMPRASPASLPAPLPPSPQTPQTAGGSDFVPGELDAVGELEEGGEFDPDELEEEGEAPVVEESAGALEQRLQDGACLGQCGNGQMGAGSSAASADGAELSLPTSTPISAPTAAPGPKRKLVPASAVKPTGLAARAGGSAGRPPGAAALAPPAAKRSKASVKERLTKKLGLGKKR